MSGMLLVALAMLVAIAAAVASAVLGLADVHSPTPGRAMRGLPASVECPRTGSVVGVIIGFERETNSMVIRQCERFGTRPVTCDRACLPVLA